MLILAKKDALICCSLNHILARCLQESRTFPFAIDDIKLLLGSLSTTIVFLYNQVFDTVIHVVLLCKYKSVQDTWYTLHQSYM